jgi:hypothetical protein
MIRIVVDENVHKVLLTLEHPAELCDSQGRVIARLTPVLDPAKYENLEGTISREELDRRKKNMDRSKMRTLSEVIADLEKRP